MKRSFIANYDGARYWRFEPSRESVFNELLVLRNVCWLQLETRISLPCPPPGRAPYRFRISYRLAVSERSNLGSPTFSVEPMLPMDAAFCTDVRRVVHNDELRHLIDQGESCVMGIAMTQTTAWRRPGEERRHLRPVAAGAERAGGRVRDDGAGREMRPRGQAEALMGRMPFMRFGGRVRMGGRRRADSIGSAVIRPVMVMRELSSARSRSVHATGHTTSRLTRSTHTRGMRNNEKEEKDDGNGRGGQLLPRTSSCNSNGTSCWWMSSAGAAPRTRAGRVASPSIASSQNASLDLTTTLQPSCTVSSGRSLCAAAAIVAPCQAVERCRLLLLLSCLEHVECAYGLEDVLLVQLHDAARHQHLVQDEVRALQVEHQLIHQHQHQQQVSTTELQMARPGGCSAVRVAWLTSSSHTFS